MPNMDLEVFDIVPFVRWNNHAKCSENFVAIWLKSTENVVHVAFQDASCIFAKTVVVGKTYTVGFTVREVYESQGHPTPPKGWDHLPRRVVIIRPQVGGYASIGLDEKRQAKLAKRRF